MQVSAYRLTQLLLVRILFCDPLWMQNIIFESVECQDGLHRPDISTSDSTPPQSLYTTAKRSEFDKQNLWHRRLGHVSCRTSDKYLPILDGIDIRKCRKLETCQPCLKDKSNRNGRKSIDDRSTQPLDLLYSDLIGPFKSAALGGSNTIQLHMMTVVPSLWSAFLRLRRHYRQRYKTRLLSSRIFIIIPASLSLSGGFAPTTKKNTYRRV